MTNPVPDRLSVALPRGDVTTWAAPLDTAVLAAYVERCREAQRDPSISTTEKGRPLEDLMLWLVAHVPGFVVRQRNVWSASRAQEVDLLVWNEQHAEGFASFGNKILVECKNTGSKVDASDVAWFDWKMRLGGVTDGILVAAHGITGEAQQQNAAQEILTHAHVDGRRILVVQLDQIAQVSSREDLRNLLIDRLLALATRS